MKTNNWEENKMKATEKQLNKYGEKYCILPSCSSLAGHDGYYCEEHHSKYYFGKTDCPMRGRMCQCSDKEKCIHMKTNNWKENKLIRRN